MQINAKARYIRMSPKKIRLILDVIRGMDVALALQQLNFINKTAVLPVKKLLDSAIANATHNFGLDKANLFIKKITADDGPTLKRWKPRAFGRATPIRKRMAHIMIVLEEKVPSKEIKKRTEKLEAPVKLEELMKAGVKVEKTGEMEEADLEKAGEQKKRELAGKKRKSGGLEDLRRRQEKGFLKKIFSRKTG